MKSAILLLSILILMPVRVRAADTNFSHKITVGITVERPLDNVIAAMQTYYYSTNYHGFAHYSNGNTGFIPDVWSTNEVPGVSYTYRLADCTFGVEVLNGDMIATRITSNSTKLELLARNLPEDSDTAASFLGTIARTLNQVAKIADSKE